MTPVIKSVELPDRVRLPYVEQGGPSGVPILLLHGVTDSIHAFALTQRGHGDADRPAAGYRTRDFEADVAAFADAVGLASAVVVGHSMGITNAQRFAIDHPERRASRSRGSSRPGVKLRIPTAEDVLKIVVQDFGPCL
jgi:non-heme chloroperoxidase